MNHQIEKTFCPCYNYFNGKRSSFKHSSIRHEIQAKNADPMPEKSRKEKLNLCQETDGE